MKRMITKILTILGFGTGLAVSQALVNLGPNDVDIVASLTTQKQVGTTVPTFVSAIQSDLTLTADKTYLLKDAVFVTDGAKLTIEAGTKIYGLSYENGAGTADNQLGSIVVTRGSQIEVLGTLAEPVLMTTVDALEALRGNDIDNDGLTAPAPTADTAGRWGGLVVLGNAFVANWSDPDSSGLPGNGDEVNLFEKSIEGFAALNFDDLDTDGFTDLVEYGNSDNATPATLAVNNVESSGIIQYLSIRHGGFALADGNEINGLTLGGVGSGTTIDHVEVVANNDDGVEFFGGTVNTSHMVVTFTEDDSFDIDQGHSGTHQFWFAITNSTAGDHGGEWDGVDGSFLTDGLGNSSPVILNATFLDAGASGSSEGIRFDDYFDGFIVNNAWGDYGVNKTFDNTGDGIGANLALEGNVFAGANNGGAATSGFNSGNTFSQALGLTSVSSVPNGLLDPRPAPGSFLLDSVNTKDFDESVIPGATVVSYSGAFSPTDLWIAGWTYLSEEGYLPSTSPLVNLKVDQVDVVASLTTPFQVGTTPGAEAYVAAIATDTTFTADKDYILTDAVFVTNGAKLTIEAGTRIYGAAYENGAGTADNVLGSIVVTRGSQIEVLGTLAEPVLMTTIDSLEAECGNDIDGDGLTASPPTADTVSRWGGLVVLGNAFVANWKDPDLSGLPGNGDEVNLFEKSIEGFAALNFDDLDNDGFSDIIEYGNDANVNPATLAVNNVESSGIIQYLSIRHGGFALSDGNEINGLTLGGVGSGTTIDHVEVVANNDDGVEFFGGTVNTSHMVVTFTEDDSFDIDQGHSGTHQFWFAITNSTAGDHGGEWDGVDGSFLTDGLGNSSPVILNATFLDAGASGSSEGIRFDDYFDGFIVNNAWGDYGVNKTFDNTGDGIGANLALEGNVFAGANNGGAATSGFNSGNTFSQALGLTSVSSVPNGLLDPRPAPGSFLLDSVNTKDFDESVIPGATVVSYSGAFSPTDLWIAGWTYLSEAGYLPGALNIIDIKVLANGDVQLTLDSDATGVTVQSSNDLMFGSFIVVPFTSVGSVITIASANVDPNVDGADYFRVMK